MDTKTKPRPCPACGRRSPTFTGYRFRRESLGRSRSATSAMRRRCNATTTSTCTQLKARFRCISTSLPCSSTSHRSRELAPSSPISSELRRSSRSKLCQPSVRQKFRSVMIAKAPEHALFLLGDILHTVWLHKLHVKCLSR